MVSNERLDGNWNSVVGAVRERFGQITGDELQRVQGNAEQLIGLLQRKTGKTREQIEGFITDCCHSTGSAARRVSDRAGEYATMAGDTVRENYDRVAQEAQRGYEYTVDTMRRRPLESVAIALGAGLFAGILLAISVKSRR